VKFVADGMLGKLSRWLRMMGHDVKYSTEFKDVELIALSKKERRVLLTRDLQLYQRSTVKGVDAFYVEGKTEAERLAELAQRFGIRLEIDLEESRCSNCNTRIRSVPKEKVAGRVEDNTFKHYGDFWECPKCKQVYWQGAHWTRIRATLREAEKSAQKTRLGLKLL
jgi:uncharacterized protein with PIN domain